jgi:predicted nucleic acid-binding protein
MPKPRVYVETTIPSAYYTDRTDPVMLAQHDWTRRWWHWASSELELVASPVVLRELLQGKSRHVPARIALLDGLELLHVSAPILATAETYIRQKLMPAKAPADALHLALASHEECGILVTWNYRHLANVHKFDRIRRLNLQLGLPVPELTTPRHLMGGGDESGPRERSAPR